MTTHKRGRPKKRGHPKGRIARLKVSKFCIIEGSPKVIKALKRRMKK